MEKIPKPSQKLLKVVQCHTHTSLLSIIGQLLIAAKNATFAMLPNRPQTTYRNIRKIWK